MRGLIVALGAGAMVLLPAAAAQAHHRHHHHHHPKHPMVGTDGHGKTPMPAPMVRGAAPGKQIGVDPNTDGHGKNQ